jgi:hypothetical protein
MSKFLSHSGVKGMRWGVRRYQNSDGSLTDAGRKRYERDQRENSGKKKGNKVGSADPNRWIKEDMERSKRLVNEGSNMANNLKNVNANRGKNRTKTKMDLSNMTDKEMRERINREFLERQYNDLFSPQKISKGKERANKILETAGSALTITGSALSIALAIKELRG